jgi:threonylcarbamoyladenosine tRNA methylthiotransferase MtaB
MSFQAGDDMVLKRMKRRHSRAAAVETVARLKAQRPDLAIGADLIAGFPTETEAMHANSLALIDDCDIVMAHIFPFSPTRGTPAARMPQLAPPLVKARAKRLREASARRKADWLAAMVGTTQRVLVERDDGSGHAENFAPVRVVPAGGDPLHSRSRRDGAEPGKVTEVAITAVDNDTLIGVPA